MLHQFYSKPETIAYPMVVSAGTSTDVSRYAGHYEHVFESTTAGVTIQAPQVCNMESHLFICSAV